MLENRLYQHGRSDIYPFHMPGHKRRLTMSNPFEIDITEIEGFDNLHHAAGVLKEAQEQAAQMYGSKKVYYLVNGSTCGILAAVSAAVSRGGKILVARNSHRAVYNAIDLRQLRPLYVYPQTTRAGLQGQINALQVEEKLCQDPEIEAVLATSPTYDGVVSNIEEIADVTHSHNIPLIVDEAHGAHFGFNRSFPENATKQGADIVIMSTHKTLPAFTQTALLHLCSERVSERLIERYLSIYETSSPSYILMSGINRCLCMIEKDGEFYFKNYVNNLEWFYQSVSDLKHLHVMTGKDFSKDEAQDFDMGKLLINTNGYVTGNELKEKLLDRFGLQMEMAGGNYVVAMTSFMDEPEGFQRLSQALHKLDSELEGKEKMFLFTPEELYQMPQKILEPFEAREAVQEEVSLDNACGRISAEDICPYPPGIPVVVAGERLTAPLIAGIHQCLEHGLEVEGLLEQSRINVVKT